MAEMTIPDAARQLRAAGFRTRHIHGVGASAEYRRGCNIVAVTLTPLHGNWFIVSGRTIGNRFKQRDDDIVTSMQAAVELAEQWARTVDIVATAFAAIPLDGTEHDDKFAEYLVFELLVA